MLQHAPKIAGRLARSRMCRLRSFSSSANSDGSNSLESNSESSSTSSVDKMNFAKAMQRISGQESFAKLIRNSEFVKLGDPEGKMVEGTVIHIVADDLYIDFGGKFNCVCPRPAINPEKYLIGKKVRLILRDMELSTRFLGATTDLTILEADCNLIGLSKPPLSDKPTA